MTPTSRVVDLFLQRALRVRVGFGRASKLHSAADVVSALFAVFAGLAGQTDFESDSVSGRQALDVGANCHHGAARLVAERQGLANNNVSISVMVEVVQI